jgi:hypothetical protein
MNIFNLAETQLVRERKSVTISAVLEKAIKIRHFMDTHTKLTEHILNGGDFIKRGDGRLKIV